MHSHVPTIRKLSSRLVLVPGLLTLALVAVLYAAAAWPLSRDLRQVAELRVRQDAQVLAQRVEVATARRITEMRQLGRAVERLPLKDLDALRAELAWLKARSNAYAWIGLTSADGRVLVATEGWLEGVSLKGRPVYENGRQGPWFGEFHPAKLLQPLLAGGDKPEVWVADVGLPLAAREGGAPAAVLVAHLNIDWLLRIGDEVLGAERQRRLGLDWGLVQADGRSLAPRAALIDLKRLPEQPGSGLAELAGAEAESARLVGYQDLSPGVGDALRWRAVVSQDLEEAMAPLTRLYTVLGGFAIASLLLGTALAWWLSQRLARPYEALVQAAQRRFQAEGAGLPEAQFLQRLGHELALPADAGPSETLLRRLASNAQQLQRVLDHLPMGLLLCDPAQRIVYANASFCALVGLPASSLQGRPALSLLLPSDTALRESLAAENGPHAASFELQASGGQRRPVAWQRVALHDREQQLDSVLMLVQDLSGEVSERRRADALQRRFALLVNSARSDGFVLLGADGLVRDWSQGAVQLSGWEAATVQGRPLRSLFQQPEAADALLAAVQRDGQAALAQRWRRADGGDFYALGRAYALNDGDGSLALIFSDATQSQEAAARLQESESRLAAVIGGASDAIISTDGEGRVLLFNPAAERIFRISQADMLGQTLERLLPPSEHGHHGQRMAAFAASETTRRPMGVGKVEGRRSDGEPVVLEAAISAARAGGRVVLTAVLRDVGERDRAERRMVEYQMQLAELTQRLLAQEKETTQRLAQVLHDELGQTLAALRLMLDAAMRREAEPPPWLARLDSTLDLANRQVRQVLTELRPPLLDEQGLQAALANELQQQRARHGEAGPEVLLDWRAEPELRWGSDVDYAAFMVAREALGNALRHAQASQVRLSVEGGQGWLRLRVEDDGVGAKTSLSKPGHLGLVGMRERALAIGARLEIGPAELGGLRVELSWRGGV